MASLGAVTRSFLQYLTVGGISCTTKDELAQHYANFQRVQPSTQKFSQVVYFMKQNNIARFAGDGTFRWYTDTIVDQRMAERAQHRREPPPEPQISEKRAQFEAHLSSLVAGRDEFERDKNGISISQLIVPPMRKNEIQTVSVFISNAGQDVHTLIKCEPLRKSTYYGLSDPQRVSDGLGQAEIPPGSTYTVRLTVRTDDYGTLQFSVFFFFAAGFKILRSCSVSVNVPEVDRAILDPSAPYTPPPPVSKATAANIIPGERLPGKPGLKVKPGAYVIPKDLEKKANTNPEAIKAILGNPITINGYKVHFHMLLWLEELQMNVDIRRFDTTQTLDPTPGGSFVLQVPGLSENRPSVLRGDRIYVSDPLAPQDKRIEYEGYVHDVGQSQVYLRFHRIFQERAYIKNKPYNVRFSFSRFPLRRMHQAIDNITNDKLIIPQAQGFVSMEDVVIQQYNRNLNAQQLRAVKYILNTEATARKVPYVIFGPPGTGKTVTVIEAILQIYHKFKKANKRCTILAAAPSNNAADLLVERLHGSVDLRDLLRVNAFSRSRSLNQIPKTVLEHSTMQGDEFVMPSLDRLCQARILVATCVTAGMLAGLGMEAGFVTHIFVDEAGQACEPECLSAISAIADDNTSIVLSGDHKQLGPVIRSGLATRDTGGLNTSYLERMMRFQVYSRDNSYERFGFYNPYFVTKLVNNYRSHPEILKIPSQLFYDAELLPMANELLRNSLCNWKFLPKKGFPIIFHGIEGRDEREGNSPSWFNQDEALTVVDYLIKLRDDPPSGTRVLLSEVGVISPYRKQVEKLRRLFAAKNLETVKVGSVEEFQGQERRIIIISTVRSKKQEEIPFDLAHNLGFLKNPKRFNVAVTRAQALLIVIGNPHILTKDQHWRTMLKYCVQNNAYVGCSAPTAFTDDEEVDQVLQQFNQLRLSAAEEGGVVAEDPAWSNRDR